MPFPPDELADLDDVLEARAAEGDIWMREVAAQIGLSPGEIEDVVNPELTGQMNH